MHFLRKYSLLSPFLLALLLSAGSAQACTECLSGSTLCDESGPPVAYGDLYVFPGTNISVGGHGTISLISSPTPISWSWDRFDNGSGGRLTLQRPGTDESPLYIDIPDRKLDWVRGWTYADAKRFVQDWQRRHPQFDFDEFRREWQRYHDNDQGDCDDDLPRPVPLPGTVLLFGPALLLLRAFQRRNG